MSVEEIIPLASLLLSAAIAAPVLTAALFVLLMARWKPDESWEKPVGVSAMGAMGFCLGGLTLLTLIWLSLGAQTWELPLPFGLLGGREVFLWNWPSAIWGLVCALMGLATVRFSITYLHREGGYVRFMATALCFLGAMLGSIVADNPVQMAIWWELIGASSLLLIGFYHDRPGPCVGAVSVLRQYRIADAGMLLGCGLLLAFEVHGEYSAAAQLTEPVRTIAGLGFVVGVLVKSAQLPFSGWLPKAMEGPTPSSALFYGGLSLHLGLVLAVRLHALWDILWVAKAIFVVCGIATAIDAGMRSRVVPDAKSSLAWSAMSTIGVLFVMIGLGLWQIVVPLIAGHAIIRWYQLLRAPSMPADLAWFNQSLGLPPARIAPESHLVNSWLALRSRLIPLALFVGQAEEAFLRTVRAPSLTFLKLALCLIPLINLLISCTWPFSLGECWVVSGAICSAFLVLICTGIFGDVGRPLLIGLSNAAAVGLAGLLVQDGGVDITRATLGAATGLVLGVMLASQRKGAVTAVSGGIGALGNISFLAVLGEHGSVPAAILMQIGAGLVGTLLIKATFDRLGGNFWTAVGGLGQGSPRIHAAFILLLGIIIGMPPFPSFQLIDGAVETASRFSPWMAAFFAVMWAVLAFRTGKGILEACWGPPRGSLAEGPLPDLVNKEWTFAAGIPILLGLLGIGVVFNTSHPEGKPSHESHPTAGLHASRPLPDHSPTTSGSPRLEAQS